MRPASVTLPAGNRGLWVPCMTVWGRTLGLTDHVRFIDANRNADALDTAVSGVPDTSRGPDIDANESAGLQDRMRSTFVAKGGGIIPEKISIPSRHVWPSRPLTRVMVPFAPAPLFGCAQCTWPQGAAKSSMASKTQSCQLPERRPCRCILATYRSTPSSRRPARQPPPAGRRFVCQQMTTPFTFVPVFTAANRCFSSVYFARCPLPYLADASDCGCP